MKTFVYSARVLAALVVLALVRIVLFTPLSSIAAFAALALVSAGTLLAFASWDYARKPSFRVRRTSPSVDQTAREIQPALNPAIDWTYAPRSA